MFSPIVFGQSSPFAFTIATIISSQPNVTNNSPLLIAENHNKQNYTYKLSTSYKMSDYFSLDTGYHNFTDNSYLHPNIDNNLLSSIQANSFGIIGFQPVTARLDLYSRFGYIHSRLKSANLKLNQSSIILNLGIDWRLFKKFSTIVEYEYIDSFIYKNNSLGQWYLGTKISF